MKIACVIVLVDNIHKLFVNLDFFFLLQLLPVMP